MHLQRIFIPGIHSRLPGQLLKSLHVSSYLHELLSHGTVYLGETSGIWHCSAIPVNSFMVCMFEAVF